MMITTRPTAMQLAREVSALDWCRQIGDHELESEFCSWLQRHAGRSPGQAEPASGMGRRITELSSCEQAKVRKIAAETVADALHLPSRGCWQCQELGRRCWSCEQVARQNKYPAAYGRY
jgi:hypothetical protein